jgi:uncharacterized protein YdcH (DUF465 family)
MNAANNNSMPTILNQMIESDKNFQENLSIISEGMIKMDSLQNERINQMVIEMGSRMSDEFGQSKKINLELLNEVRNICLNNAINHIINEQIFQEVKKIIERNLQLASYKVANLESSMKNEHKGTSNTLKGQDAKLGKILSRSDQLKTEIDRIVEDQEKLMEMLSRSNAEHEQTRNLMSNIENGISKEVQKKE